jgi:flagellar basal-body rod protein FlgF
MLSPSLVLLSNQTALAQSMDIIANNVANASTTGFKREGIEFDTFLSRPAPNKTINFVTDRATYRDTSTGSITPTGNPLDVAIQGSGYFAVHTPDSQTRYTRGGSFHLDPQGQLVTQAGLPVLTDSGAAFTIPNTVQNITITSDGYVSARVDKGTALSILGKIGVATFADEQAMQPLGNGLYTTTQSPQPATDRAVLVQGSIEQSNVQPVSEMTDMIRISRSYQQATNLINQENERLTTAINILSKTSV